MISPRVYIDSLNSTDLVPFVSGQEQSRRRLPIDHRTAQRIERLIEGRRHKFDDLIRFEPLGGCFEIEGCEEMNDLVAEARRRPDRPEPFESSRAITGLFLEFSKRARFRGLTRIEFSGRNFENLATGRESVLPNQQHVLCIEKGNHRGGTWMLNQIEFDAIAIRKIHGLRNQFDVSAAGDARLVWGVAKVGHG